VISGDRGDEDATLEKILFFSLGRLNQQQQKIRTTTKKTEKGPTAKDWEYIVKDNSKNGQRL
jgi:hypothetical protein